MSDDQLYRVAVYTLDGSVHYHDYVVTPQRDPSGALALFAPNQEVALALYAPGMWRNYTTTKATDGA